MSYTNYIYKTIYTDMYVYIQGRSTTWQITKQNKNLSELTKNKLN